MNTSKERKANLLHEFLLVLQVNLPFTLQRENGHMKKMKVNENVLKKWNKIFYFKSRGKRDDLKMARQTLKKSKKCIILKQKFSDELNGRLFTAAKMKISNL